MHVIYHYFSLASLYPFIIFFGCCHKYLYKTYNQPVSVSIHLNRGFQIIPMRPASKIGLILPPI
jgi:hypothetical protein